MKILVSSINFHPDHSGIALYSTDLPVFFAERGHSVTMVTGFSYYPAWKKRPEDHGRLFRTEEFRRVRTLRGYLYVPTRVTTLRRIWHELSFVAFATLNFLRAGRHDCIVILSPPLLLGLVGVLFRRLWKAQLVFHIQDLQPDAALSLGMVKHGALIRLLLRIEKLIYRESDWVATITEAMRERLVAKGVPAEKLGLYYNWIDVAQASEPRPAGRFRSAHKIPSDAFVVAYAGNVGIKQGVDVLLEVADGLRQDPRFRFFIIGEGADRQRLLDRAAERNLPNLQFLPFLGPDDYRDMLQDIQVSFVAQRAGTGNVFFPSKLLGIMAQSKPLLIAADPDSELATVIREGGCGRVAATHDTAQLIAHLRELVEHPAELQRLGQNGRKLVEKFDREVVLSGFLERLRQGASPKAAAPQSS